ncbi:MAG: 50S ribosomal protein L32e [Euryarchaeota archaeon HGW-Euryarchaeota-1]|nr:MAG: 50S ribosomal protein L32e [Euryarchaeota archaeon HGW-Euryarchaeota-1]
MSKKNKSKILKTGIKKPRFVRVSLYSTNGKLDEKWRVPGIHSHFRRKTEFPHKRPNIGYKQPENLRGMHPSGLKPVWINNLKELENVDPKTQGIYVASTVGARLKTKIVEDAKKKGIKIFNPKINRKIKIKKVKKPLELESKKKGKKTEEKKQEAEKVEEKKVEKPETKEKFAKK